MNGRPKMSKQDQNSRAQHKVKCTRCGRNHFTEDCFLEKGVYFRCKKEGHIAAQCPEKEGSCPRCGRHHKLKDCLVAKGACFHCKQLGHKISDYLEKASQV